MAKSKFSHSGVRVPVLCGAFGGMNAGDEAIAATMIRQVRRVFGDGPLEMVCLTSESNLESYGYRDRVRTEPDVRIHSRKQLRSIVGALRHGPLIIGGGQLLNGSSRPIGLLYLWTLALIARVFGQDVALIGVGARNIDCSWSSKIVCRALVRTATLVSVRDQHTKRALIDIGVQEEKIHLTADVVLSGAIAPSSPSSQARNDLVFAVHHSPRVKHYSAAEFAAFVDHVAGLHDGLRVILACHDGRLDFDVAFAQAVAEHCDTNCEVVVLQDERDALAAYQRAHVVHSSRMHPLILGLLAGAKVVPIAASEKVADFAALVGTRPVEILSDQGMPSGAELANAAVDSLPGELVAAAEDNFRLLSSFSRRPDFLIVGAMKAGTTSIYGDLQAIDGVWMPAQKEPEVLIRNKDRVAAAADYADLFRNAPVDALVGEASTGYTKRPLSDGAAAMAAALTGGELKVIYVTRDPVARIESHLRHDALNGMIGEDFGQALRSNPDYVNFSRYDWQIAPWKQAFGEANVLEVSFEDYVADRPAVLRAIGAHLGVDVNVIPPDAPKNTSAGRATARFGFIGKAGASTFYKRRVKPLIPSSVHGLALSVLAPKKSAPPIRLDQDDCRFVAEQLAPEANDG